MKKTIKLLLLFIVIFSVGCSKKKHPKEEPVIDPPVIPEEKLPTRKKDYLLGSLFSFQKDLRAGKIESAATTFYNMPLYAIPGTDDEWWDNLVEEIDYSGLDYVAANCRGTLPYPNKYQDHGDPNRVKDLVAAMERRGVQDKFKIAIFDDCPASWSAARNFNLGYGYTTDRVKYPYPLDKLDDDTDNGIYKYIWDYNIKIAFQNVPDKYLLKFQERPVLILWSVNNFIDYQKDSWNNGKISPILNRLRNDFKATFGKDPFIIADRSFQDRDKTVYYPVVDAFNDWFTMDKPYTVRRHSARSIGVGVPGFSVNDLVGNPMFIDANHGKTLTDGLTNMVAQNSELILIEGFVDVAENAALWRSTDTKYYDYPNQRLNILKRFSKEPFPAEIKLEAEGCDYYEDKTSGNSGGLFRKGDLDVKKCNDINVGWAVTDARAGEWLQWREIPLRKKSVIEIRYLSGLAAQVRYNIDGKDTKIIQLPASDNRWNTVQSEEILMDSYTAHDVKLKIVAGNIDVNYLKIIAK